jgi:hypothetical protein
MSERSDGDLSRIVNHALVPPVGTFDSSITRHDFGLTYELFKEAGGLLVGRDVAIDIDAEAIRPQ